MRFLLVILLTVNLYALSDKQELTLIKVKQEARKYTSYPSTIAAICLVESSAGKNRVGDKDASLGLLQIRVATVRWLSEQCKALEWTIMLSDYDIEKLLLSNDRFSVEVASRYIQHYIDHGWTYTDSVIIYNGWWEVDHNGKLMLDKNGKKKKNYKYYNKVMKAKRVTRGL